MQTFLPYPSFGRSAAVLENRRLGKQRVEVLQVLRALHLEGYGWAHHPAVLMWRGHTRALVAYGLAVVGEWCHRGYADSTLANIVEFARPHPALAAAALPDRELPPWLGCTALHRSHRAALVRKNPEVYASAFPDAPPDLPYVWPDPPAAEPATEPFTAWVVRAGSPEVLASFRAAGFVGVPARLGTSRATPKQRRQFHRLCEVADIGERVTVPDGGDLHAGVLVGTAVERRVAEVPYVGRDAVWDRTVPRSSLRRPYQLQDPQAVFALRGETDAAV